jgi:hypothetical protein
MRRNWRGVSVLAAGVLSAAMLLGAQGTGSAASMTVTPPTATIVTPPTSTDTLTTWVRHSTFPELRAGCVSRTAVSNERTPSGAVAIPCSPDVSLQEFPASVPADWQTYPTYSFITLIKSRTGASDAVARKALADAAGVNTWQLPTTVGSLALKITTRVVASAATVSIAEIGTASAGSTFCGSAGGSTKCATVDGLAEAILWGAIIGGVLGGGLGAAIGSGLAALWAWLKAMLE